MSFENAIYDWQEGERRVRDAPPDRRVVLERIVDLLVAELRRRLGGAFTTQELLELYGHGTDWCHDLAARAAPSAPWAWEARIVGDAAFARYVREAADYAGGRRLSAR